MTMPEQPTTSRRRAARLLTYGGGALLLLAFAALQLPAFPLDDPAASHPPPQARPAVDKGIDAAAAARNGEAAPSSLSTGRSVRTVDLALPTDEVARMLTRGQSLMESGDFAAARLFLARAADAGSPDAVFALAETYDPNVLSARGARGLVGEPDQATALYRRALAAGVQGAEQRLTALSN